MKLVGKLVWSAILSLNLAAAAWAAETDLVLKAPEKVFIGQPFLVRFQSAVPVDAIKLNWLGKEINPPLEPASSGRTALALLGTDVKYAQDGFQEVLVTASAGGRKTTLKRRLRLASKKYPEEHLKVPPKMVTPPPEAMERIKKEVELVTKALATISPARWWALPFLKPVPGRVISVYGMKRILNNKPSSQHRGADFFAGAGEPIKAMNPGRVILTGDHYFAGQSVYLDHGQGLLSVYFHLSRINVQEGQTIVKGDTLGLVGATGLATGPHLHFGVYIFGQAVDPVTLLDQHFGRDS
ncbi:MAG: M23 family metallopeptidase [Thermodesulfobacteriota bacterium]